MKKDVLAHISFRIPRSDLKLVQVAAEDEKVSIGHILRRAVGYYVKGEAGYNRRTGR